MTDLDTLMNLDPNSLTRENIDDLITYYRKQRSGGPKPKKETGPSIDIDIHKLGLVPAAPTYRRR